MDIGDAQQMLKTKKDKSGHLQDAGCEVIVGDKITGTSDYGDRKELAKLLDEIEEGSLLILG